MTGSTWNLTRLEAHCDAKAAPIPEVVMLPPSRS